MNKEACEKNIKRRVEISATNPRALVVEMNLEMPIPEQLKIISKVASSQQEQLKKWGLFGKGRKDVALWPCYLQLLDAIEAGATRPELNEVLFKNTDKKTYNNWKKKAEDYRDKNYLKIALL